MKLNEYLKINEDGEGGGASCGSGDSSGVAFVGNNQNGMGNITIASAPSVAGSLWQTNSYNVAPGQKANPIGSGDSTNQKKKYDDDDKGKSKGKGKDKVKNKGKSLFKPMLKFSQFVGPNK